MDWMHDLIPQWLAHGVDQWLAPWVVQWLNQAVAPWVAPWVAPCVALAQVVMIDVALAGDNAVVVGMAVAGLPPRQKRPAILLGIGGATVIRIALGAVALQLLAIIGLLLAGGILLLWVCWKMFRELRRSRRRQVAGEGTKTLRQAMMQIMLADVSMSLDNVLAVAGAAHDRLWVLTAGLLLSVALMGLAASLVARLLERYRWIAWVGLLIVTYVALAMVWHGGHEVAGQFGPDQLPHHGGAVGNYLSEWFRRVAKQ